MTQSVAKRESPGEVTALNDAALIRRVARGDSAAFESLYRAYVPRLHSFLQRALHWPTLVEEVLDDTLLVVWRKARHFDASAKVSTWIFAIARRKALKALSRNRDAPALHAANDAASATGPESELQELELRERVAHALTRLPADQSVVLRLAYFDGYACSEIAHIMDCPVDTVKTRAFHGRRRLRTLLAERAY